MGNNRPKTRKGPAMVRVFLTPEEERRINKGPLAYRSGFGKADWLKRIMLEALDAYERGANSVQGQALAQYMKEAQG